MHCNHEKSICSEEVFCFYFPPWCLKNSTWRKRFKASSRVLYGPPKFFFVFSEITWYPSFLFVIIIYMPNRWNYYDNLLRSLLTIQIRLNDFKKRKSHLDFLYNIDKSKWLKLVWGGMGHPLPLETHASSPPSDSDRNIPLCHRDFLRNELYRDDTFLLETVGGLFLYWTTTPAL